MDRMVSSHRATYSLLVKPVDNPELYARPNKRGNLDRELPPLARSHAV